MRHPERENLYKYIGRLDDTLVHILGEKTNPVPMELCIRGNSPYVAEGMFILTNKWLHVVLISVFQLLCSVLENLKPVALSFRPISQRICLEKILWRRCGLSSNKPT